MYQKEANDTFSFLLTVDEFRSAVDEEHRPSWVDLTTMTIFSTNENEGVTVDLKKITDAFQGKDGVLLKSSRGGAIPAKWTLKAAGDKCFYNQLTLCHDDGRSNKSVKIFPNSTVHVTGCQSLFDARRTISMVNAIIKELCGVDINSKYRVAMINSFFSCPYALNLRKVEELFKAQPEVFETSFQPDTYSGVKIKFKPSYEMKEITCSIFATGGCVITGCQTLREVAFAFNVVMRMLVDNADVHVKRVGLKEEKPTLGYRNDHLVSLLREKGFRSWVLTTENPEINF